MTSLITPLSVLTFGLDSFFRSTLPSTNSKVVGLHPVPVNSGQSKSSISSPTPYANDEVNVSLRFDPSTRLHCSSTRGLRFAADGVEVPDCIRHLCFMKSALDSCYVIPSRFASFFKILGSCREATSLTIDCKPRVDFFDDSISERLWIRERLFGLIADMPDLTLLSLPFRDPDSLMDMANDTNRDWSLYQIRYFSITSKEPGIPLNRYLLAVTMICPNLTHISYTVQPRNNILKLLKQLILPRALETFILFVPYTHNLCDRSSGKSMQEGLREWVGDHRIVVIRVHAKKFKHVYRDTPDLAFQRGLISLGNCVGCNLDGQYPKANQDQVWAVADDIVRRRREVQASWEEGANIQYLEDVDMPL